MEKIDTLSSLEGRKLLQDIFKELRYEKQLSTFSTLSLCWRICVQERDIHRYTKKDVTVLHSLGFFSGTGLWMEEIVNRFYFSSINSFVYFGAAVLLVIIGVRRFTDAVNENLVIGGIAFEALMLIFLFVVMLFTPYDDNTSNSNEKEEESGELLSEIGEIGRDFAAAVMQLEKLGDGIKELISKQDNILEKIDIIADNTTLAVYPNPQMLVIMRETNEKLAEFQATVENFNRTAQSIKKEEIEFAVRKELERIIVDKVSN
jgi:hypothetical protein